MSKPDPGPDLTYASAEAMMKELGSRCDVCIISLGHTCPTKGFDHETFWSGPRHKLLGQLRIISRYIEDDIIAIEKDTP